MDFMTEAGRRSGIAAGRRHDDDAGLFMDGRLCTVRSGRRFAIFCFIAAADLELGCPFTRRRFGNPSLAADMGFIKHHHVTRRFAKCDATMLLEIEFQSILVQTSPSLKGPLVFDAEH